MVSNFRYRWCYALIITVVLIMVGYLYVLKPQIVELSALREQEKQLKAELSSLQHVEKNIAGSASMLASPSIGKMDLLSLLPTLARLHGVNLRFIRIKAGAMQPTNETRMSVMVEGEFTLLLRFVFSLTEQVQDLLIESFSYQVSKQRTLQLALELYKSPRVTSSTKFKAETITTMQNPFCLAFDNAAHVHAHDALGVSMFSIKQMKMTGYLSQGGREEALLVLPTGAIVEVSVGDELGSEKALITGIQADHVGLVVSGRQDAILLSSR